MTNDDLKKKMLELYDQWTPDLSAVRVSQGQVYLRFFETRDAAEKDGAPSVAQFTLTVTGVKGLKFELSEGCELQQFVGAYVEGDVLGLDFSIDAMKLEISPEGDVIVAR